MFKNALVSVSDKTGLVDFLKPFVARGLRVVSTGGTLKHLRDNGIKAIDVSEQTGFPEVMDGRVKTLHPRVHMALLARSDNSNDMSLLAKEGLEPFDLVIVNLYPFEAAREKGARGDQLIEYIDVGGPSMLRAAAKSFERLVVVCDPSDYSWIAEKPDLSLADRRRLAARVFAHTSQYDDLIAKSFQDTAEQAPTLIGREVAELRYGENPQQRAWWMRDPLSESGLHRAEILHGKQLSFNNILDLEAATLCAADFSEPCAVAVKHNNPCGVGTASSVSMAVALALQADPVSVFGGIMAINQRVDLESAEQMAKIFLECIVAPDFDADALERLKKKKDLRILKWPELSGSRGRLDFRTISGGFLVQEADRVTGRSSDWKVVVGQDPSESVWRDISLAWRVSARLKSNAIAIAAGGRTVGLGMGQVNRVDAVDQAIQRMKTHHSQLENAVLASDAFFPFADSIEKAADAGLKWIVQPGGSIRDDEVISKAKARGVNMILTGTRHFRH